MVFEKFYDFTFSGFYSFNQHFDELEANDIELGSGKFGKVYAVTKIDGNTFPIPLIIKQFTGPVDRQQKCFDTIVALQKRLYNYIKIHFEKPDEFFTHYPGLIAIPLCSFRAELNGEKIFAYCCQNLNEAGFIDFEKFFEGTEKAENLTSIYLEKPLVERLLIGYRFLSALNFLKQELRFQHADIKAESVWINSKENIAALIDFDGGVVYGALFTRANTWGTPNQDWFAPELMENASSVDPEKQYKVTWESDYWSASIGLYFLLTLSNPYQFLPDYSTNSFQYYFDRFKWPDANYPEQEDFIEYQKDIINKLHGSVASYFRDIFREGYYKKNKRIDFYRWQIALKAALSELYIPIIQADFTEEAVLQYEPAQLRWQTQRANHLQVNGNNIDLQGTQAFIFTNTGKVLLRARNEFASSEYTAEIRVIPLPVIRSFIANALMVKQGQEVIVHWQVENALDIWICIGKRKFRVNHLNEYSFIADKTESIRLIVDSELKLTQIERSLDVQVILPVIIEKFEVTPSYLIQTKPVTIQWSVRNANIIRLDPDGLEVKSSGIHEDYPNENPKVYRLIAQNELFSQELSIIISVFLVQVPPIKLPIPPSLPPYGKSFKLPSVSSISPSLLQIQQKVDSELNTLLELATEAKISRSSRWYKRFLDRIRP